MAREPFNPYLIKPSAKEKRRGAAGPLTVSQVTSLVADAIAAALPTTMHVVGELSNYKRHSSGHLYFTLKDAQSELSCVMWRSAAEKLKFDPADGLAVIATGGIEIFERAGRYQLYVRTLEPRGVGALELAFRQLCEKLEKEGLFDPARKKPLPAYPRRIVIVTSPTGAAIADMLRTIERRYPCVDVLVYPVRVQGPGAAEQIARAIACVNKQKDALGGVDVMIVGRGGGSLEDLWAFNEEAVARAIYASQIPVVSAVGHEVDVTVADLVADVRAATPTAAAELVVPVLTEIAGAVDRLDRRMRHGVTALMKFCRAQLSALEQRRTYREPKLVVRHREQIVDEWSTRLSAAMVRRVHRLRGRLDHTAPLVQRIAPHAYLLRTMLRVERVRQALERAIAQRQARCARMLSKGQERLDRASPERRFGTLVARIDALDDAVRGAVRHRLGLSMERLNGQEGRLAAIGYESVLARGYSVTRMKKGHKLVRAVADVQDGDRLVTRVADGSFESTVVNKTQRELFD